MARSRSGKDVAAVASYAFIIDIASPYPDFILKPVDRLGARHFAQSPEPQPGGRLISHDVRSVGRMLGCAPMADRDCQSETRPDEVRQKRDFLGRQRINRVERLGHLARPLQWMSFRFEMIGRSDS